MFRTIVYQRRVRLKTVSAHYFVTFAVVGVLRSSIFPSIYYMTSQLSLFLVNREKVQATMTNVFLVIPHWGVGYFFSASFRPITISKQAMRC